LKITIESTNQIVMVENREGDCRCAVPGRVWEGKTDTGIYVQCVITRIAAPADADLAQFDRELTEQLRPMSGPQVFPLRMVL
jgi:hypothetical protein